MKSLSCVRLFATPRIVAYQAPLSMGFCRQEYWSGLLFPSPGESSRPRDRTHVSCISCTGRWILNPWAAWEAPMNLSAWGQCPRVEGSCGDHTWSPGCPVLSHPVTFHRSVPTSPSPNVTQGRQREPSSSRGGTCAKWERQWPHPAPSWSPCPSSSSRWARIMEFLTWRRTRGPGPILYL